MPSKLFKLLRAGDIADDHIDDFEAILFSHFQSPSILRGGLVGANIQLDH